MRLEDEVWSKRHVPLGELARAIFPGEEPEAGTAATLELLRLGSMARLDPYEYPLIPHRLHLLVRAPDGVAVCLNPSCPGEPQFQGFGTITSDVQDRCRHCDHVLLE